MSFDGDFGLQFTIHIANQYTVPDLVDLADLAAAEGFDQVWINDNLGYRNTFVALTAVAAAVPIGVGSAVAVPYFRNPVDLADTIGAITELTDGREVSVGIGRGSIAQTGNEVETPRPYAMLAETVDCVGALLDGEGIRFGDYPLLTDYFNLQPDGHMRLRFTPQAPVRFYIGGYGPTALRMAGEHMDGAIYGGMYIPLLRAGRMGDLYGRIRDSAEAAGRPDPRLIAEVNVSIANDAEAAREAPRPYVAHSLMTLKRTGFTPAEFETLGVNPENVDAIETAFDQGSTIQEAARLVTDAMVDATFIAGDAEDCRSQLADLLAAPETGELEQVVLAKLGPDYEEAIELLADDVLPRL